jgi:arylsulfatase A-like enzyme
MAQPFNVVLVTWHDAGNWFGHTGTPGVHTPGVDRLAREGVRFTRCFSASAICSPSRAALMTGRTCQANGVMGLTNTVFDNAIRPGLTHLSRRFKRRGYHTSLLGVQHECAPEHVPRVIDPDERVATEPWPDSDRLADEVGAWVGWRAAAGRPFFGQIGLRDAHIGWFLGGRGGPTDLPPPDPVDPRVGADLPGWLAGSDADRVCVDVVRRELTRGDRVLASLLDALDRHQLSEQTLVVMAVDHGVGLSRAKGTGSEQAFHVAWLMRQPGVIPAGRAIDSLSTHVDLTPTIAGLLRWDIEDPLDGQDFSQHVRDEHNDPLHEHVFGHMTEAYRSVRSDRYRLTRNFRPPRTPVGRPGDCGERHHAFDNPFARVDLKTIEPTDEFPLLELYDVGADPDQLRNLADDPAHARDRDRLDRVLWRELQRQDDFVLYETPATPWQRATRAQLDTLRQDTSPNRRPSDGGTR